MLEVCNHPAWHNFRFILEMTPFSWDPKPVFALIQAKRQGYSWLLGHIFIHFTSHILLSFVFASAWFDLLAHSQVWHEKFVFSHLFFYFILFFNTISRNKLPIFMQSPFFLVLNSSCITLLFMPMITRIQFSDK